MSLKDWAMASRNNGVSLNRVSLAVTVQLLVVFGGLPAIAIAVILLWRSGWSRDHGQKQGIRFGGFLAVSLQGLAEPVKLTHHLSKGIGPPR